MTESLVIPSFGAGVVLAASAEALEVGELQQADGADLGERGQLISAAIASLYTDIDVAGGVANPLNPIYGLFAALWGDDVQCVVCGAQAGGGGHVFARFDPATEGATVPMAKVDLTFAINLINPHGHIATFASFPYVKAGAQLRPLIMNISARLPDLPGTVSIGAVILTYAAGVYTWRFLSSYDTLGTGNLGEFAGGTKAKFLKFRVIEAYNNHIFGAGFDNSDGNKDGPNRLMFSNLGNPLKWGNDNILAVGVDRDFSDTDAINVGAAGEIIVALRSAMGRLWIGTNRGLHFLAGYGRDSFVTDGTTAIAKALDVIGANAMIEGPDGILYGVSSRGLWSFEGEVQHLYKKLVDTNGHSAGYWDLVWYDATRAAGGYPGRTNADLVWMLSVPELKQVWVVIPFCDATAGFGYGADTVVIKYHTETGGFTRQIFTGVSFTHGVVVKRSAVNPDMIIFVNSPVVPSAQNVWRYRYRATQNANPLSAPMTLKLGEYALFGPNGVGICRVVYPTISWESDAIPIVSQVTVFVDGQQVDTFSLTVGPAEPGAPGDGDLWLDTSGTDTSLGNATAGVTIVASNDYLLKRRITSWAKWVPVTRAQGMKANRATIPMAFKPTKGTRVKLTLTVSGTGRTTIESLGLKPDPVRGAA